MHWGAKGGAATHTITAAQIPAHTHGSAGAHTHSINNCSAAGSKASQLAYLGLGEYTEADILKVQKKYFKRKADQDGKYGPDTDRLIVNLYRVKKYAPHFSITEFRCHCNGKYCTGYPEYLSVKLLQNLEKVRVKFGVTNVTSGMRCKVWNSKRAGSATNSRHTQGKAVDIAGAFTKTSAQRNKVKSYWYSLSGSNYCYHGTSNMGMAVHCDVK